MPDVIQGIEHRPLIVGRTLFDYADEVSSAVPQSCRRTGRCRECVVEVREGLEGLSPRTPPEAYLKGGFRLACQATIETTTTDIDFAIIRRRMRILEAMEAPATRLDPVVTADDTAVFYAGQPIGLRRNHVLGLAIDIGTTTVVFRIIDLLTGEAVAGGALENPQRFGGSDVMTRISYEKDFPGAMRLAVRRALNHALRDLYREHGIDRHEVYEAIIVANSTMRDLFFGIDIGPDRRVPVQVDHRGRRCCAGRSDVDLGPPARARGRAPDEPPRARGRCARSSPVTSVATPRRTSSRSSSPTGQGIRMLIDIGTNTEVVVTDGTRFLAASCPAGPAFEGGLLRFGMPGADGAIETIQLDGEAFTLGTIGDVEPGRHLRLGARRRPRRAPARALDERGGSVPRRPRRVLRRAGAGHHASRARTRACSPRPRPPTRAASGSCSVASA